MERTRTASLHEIAVPGSAPAVFGFPEHNLIHINIPRGSTWRMPYHWHDRQVDAARLRVLKGGIIISIVHHVNDDDSLSEDQTLGSADLEGLSFRLDEAVAWRTDQSIETTVETTANEALHRNICSARLDRDVYPRLRATPLWVKGVFAMLWWSPRLQQKLVDVILWIQLQTIFWDHDLHFDHGFVPFTWPWICQPFGGKPPKWATRLERQSQRLISKVIAGTSAGMGKTLFGMQGEYAEYTPRRNSDEKLDSDK